MVKEPENLRAGDIADDKTRTFHSDKYEGLSATVIVQPTGVAMFGALEKKWIL